MGTTRTVWHLLLYMLLRQRGPRTFAISNEVHLALEPLRADSLLLKHAAALPADDPPRVFRKLWERLPHHAILEFKSVGRPYRGRNLDTLLCYLAQYYATQHKQVRARAELCGVLLVPARRNALLADAAGMGLTWEDLGDGYWKLVGLPYVVYVVELRVVAEAEADDLLYLLASGDARTVETRRWLAEQVGAEEIEMEMQELEGYDELIEKLLLKVAPEKVINHYNPAQRLAGLDAADIFSALPESMPRGLPADYLATLPEPVREAIRKRLGRPTGRRRAPRRPKRSAT